MSTDIEHYDPRTGEVVQFDGASSSVTSVPAMVRAEIDAAIATAKMFPRDEDLALKKAEKLATRNTRVAARCLYAKPQGDGDKSVEGPSARFAEILSACWGNLRVNGRIIEEADRFITAQGQCVDLETGYGLQFDLRRPIWGRYGRYKDNMIAQTMNAAISIATRNAILKVIPRALWEDVYQAAKETVIGDMRSIEEARSRWLDYWKATGVSESEVLRSLGVSDRKEVTFDCIAIMIGWSNAVKDKETSVDEIFRRVNSSVGGGATATAKLAQQIKSQREQKSGIDHPHARLKGQPTPPVTQAEADAVLSGQNELPFEPGSKG